MSPNKKIYFASDFHLGVPNREKSLAREKKIVRWLDHIKVDAEEIFLVGDIFDFWFEYKTAVPKGFVRLLGKMAEITDSGIPIHVFTGNHDMWMFDYLETEIGVQLYRAPIHRTWQHKDFFIGHGDGLGPGDTKYKMLKAVFANKICQWAFARIHPNIGIGIANFWSRRSRLANAKHDEIFYGEDKERLLTFCKEQETKMHFDYYIFGHRHLPLELKVNENSTYFNLGEWVNYYTYVVFDGQKCEMKKFD